MFSDSQRRENQGRASTSTGGYTSLSRSLPSPFQEDLSKLENVLSTNNNMQDEILYNRQVDKIFLNLN